MLVVVAVLFEIFKKAKQEQEQGKATRKLLKKKIKEDLPTIAECMMNAWLNE
mgnify:CR=1 FL=1